MSGFSLATIFALCLAFNLSRACRHVCQGDSCNEDPGPCKDGEVVVCGLRQCAKGPGDPCGGPDNRMGVCGAGMHCSKKRPGGQGHCSGCSKERLENGHKPVCISWSHNNYPLY
ncbi:Neuroparsin [Nesidiocoris tenuis]|uniref:Neuroparsin n=1 Tax=Nesidiocoris tenuis TaxID=355587 RepID=A0ABN7B3T7_9HEMI|nr:Neuroparsin [Nesidiocoris tenuis]